VNATVDGDVARYAAAVRAAFADLPAPDREALLEDIEDHLVEVAAEPGGPLEERLGPPEAYAAELRAWAGLPSGATRRRGPRTSRLARRLQRLGAAAAAHPPAGPWRSSCRSCGPPGGCCAAGWRCSSPASAYSSCSVRT
jgi:hypothetical protein